MALLTIQSDRFVGKTLLVATASNLDGDQGLDFEQPNNFGDCMLEAVRISVTQFATVAASLFELGVSFGIVHTLPLDLADIVGVGKWHLISGTFAAPTSATAFVEPWRSVLWRSGESLRIAFAEVDTNASPTVDLTVQARVVRLRTTP